MCRRHEKMAPRTGRSHSFAGQLAGLLHPSGELSFVELVVVDVEVYEADLQLVDGDKITDACVGSLGPVTDRNRINRGWLIATNRPSR